MRKPVRVDESGVVNLSLGKRPPATESVWNNTFVSPAQGRRETNKSTNSKLTLVIGKLVLDIELYLVIIFLEYVRTV